MLFLIHKGLVRIDIDLCYRMVGFLAHVELEILKSPYHHRDLPPHIVNIILGLDIETRSRKYTGKRVAYHGISYMTDVQRAVRVCRSMLKDHFSLIIKIPEIISFKQDAQDRFVQKGSTCKEIDIRP